VLQTREATELDLNTSVFTGSTTINYEGHSLALIGIRADYRVQPHNHAKFQQSCPRPGNLHAQLRWSDPRRHLPIHGVQRPAKLWLPGSSVRSILDYPHDLRSSLYLFIRPQIELSMSKPGKKLPARGYIPSPAPDLVHPPTIKSLTQVIKGHLWCI
jgi:hypothetical protein